MQKKLEYSVIGGTLSLLNIALINTQYTLVGLGFGVAGAIFFIKALMVKHE